MLSLRLGKIVGYYWLGLEHGGIELEYLIIIGFCVFTLTSLFGTIKLRIRYIERKASFKSLLSWVSRVDLKRARHYLLSLIMKPKQMVKTLFDVGKLAAKIFIRIFIIFAINRRWKGTWYSILSVYILGSFLIMAYGKNSRLNVFIELAASLGVLIATWLFLEVGNRMSLKEESFGLPHYLFISLFTFFLAFAALIPYEKIKNNGIHDPSTLYLLFGLSLYIMIILAKELKSILDKGEILLSSLGGIFIYLVFLLFSSLAVGFYFGAVSPELFPKPNLNTNLSGFQLFVSYIAYYSLLGAKQLSQFPMKESNLPLRILYSEYITYIIGLFVNLIIIAFFVSYSVSLYILKKSDKYTYNTFIKTPSYIDGYIKYLERKIKRIFMMVLKEYRLFKEQKIKTGPVIKPGNPGSCAK